MKTYHLVHSKQLIISILLGITASRSLAQNRVLDHQAIGWHTY